jgi:pyruvate/2-oxoglutarate dehydrogenase complex dihydrolipoamide acyltransferase (E2) component
VSRVDLTVPDIGNFADILVVEVLVKKGDSIEVDTPLVTLETDKASMDVPATSAGTITDVLLKPGDKVSKGTVIARVETNSQADAAGAAGAVDSGLTTGGPVGGAVVGPSGAGTREVHGSDNAGNADNTSLPRRLPPYKLQRVKLLRRATPPHLATPLRRSIPLRRAIPAVIQH